MLLRKIFSHFILIITFTGFSYSSLAKSNALDFQSDFSSMYVESVLSNHSNNRNAYTLESNQTDHAKEIINKDWTGAMQELGTILVLGRLSYMAGGETIERDFDYEIEGNEFEYFGKRLFTDEYWKFDDNTKGMNWGHAYAGMIYHQAFRNHNFSYYESVLATFVTSTVWEVFFEYKEVVSINDQFFTTWGGAVLGESFFQIGDMLYTKEGWIPATFAALFNPANAIKRIWRDPKTPVFSRKNVHDVFNVYTGITYASHDIRDLNEGILVFGLDAKVDRLNEKAKVKGNTPKLVEVEAMAGLSKEGLEDFQLMSKVLLWSKQGASHANMANNQAFSNRYYIGPSIGIEYVSYGADRETEDFFSAVHLLGLDAASKWTSADMSFLLRGSFYGDFAMVKPFATQGVPNYRDFFWNTKSSLWENAYAYALGYTLDLFAEMNYSNYTLGLKLRSQRWDSIDNKEYERFSDWNPNNKDLDFKDSRDRLKAYVKYQITPKLQIDFSVESIRRFGEFFGIDNPEFYARAKDTETRTSLQLHYQY